MAQGGGWGSGGGGWGGQGGAGQPPGPGQPYGGGGYGFPPPPPMPPGGGGFGGGPGQGGFPPPGQGGYLPPGQGGYGPPGQGGPGPAWEDRSQGGFFGRWYATVRATTMEPRAFFKGVKASEDPMPAVMFSAANGLIVGLVFGLMFASIYLIAGAFGALAALAEGGSKGGGGAAVIFAIVGAVGVFAVVVYPMLFAASSFINPWIQGGIAHLSLALLGGTKRPYQSTVRVAAYASGPLALLLIPCVGMAAAVCQIISFVVGLDETHECGIGKATIAVLLFPTLCCALYVVVVVGMSVLGAVSR